MSKTVLYQTIQFSISMQFKYQNRSISSNFSLAKVCRLDLFNPYIGPYQVLPLQGQSGPESNGNEGVLHIPQRTSPSDCLVSYPGYSLGVGSYSLQPQQQQARFCATYFVH